MIRGIEFDLLALDPEPWDEEFRSNVLDDDDGSRTLARFCEQILGVYQKHCENAIKGGWFRCLESPGEFTPIAFSGVCKPENIKSISRDSEETIAANRAGLQVVEDDDLDDFAGLVVGPTILLRLVCHNEYFGLFAMCAGEWGEINSNTLNQVSESDSAAQLLGEAVFSKRLKSLVTPIEIFNNKDRDSPHNEVAHRACVGLAADGSVLRLCESSPLRPRSSYRSSCGEAAACFPLSTRNQEQYRANLSPRNRVKGGIYSSDDGPNR